LQRAAGYIRKQLGRRVKLRVLPELRFEYDASLDAGDKIEQLLAGVRDN